MDADEPGWPMIDDFFRDETQGRTTATVRRYLRVRQRLHVFLDTADMALVLGTEPAGLLDAERQFHAGGAFWAIFGPDELVCCLPSFVHQTWLPEGLAESRTQVSLTSRLLTHLSKQPDFDRQGLSCALWEAEAAVTHARQALAARSLEAAPEPRMPDRFRQQPGPEW